MNYKDFEDIVCLSGHEDPPTHEDLKRLGICRPEDSYYLPVYLGRSNVFCPPGHKLNPDYIYAVYICGTNYMPILEKNLAVKSSQWKLLDKVEDIDNIHGFLWRMFYILQRLPEEKANEIM